MINLDFCLKTLKSIVNPMLWINFETKYKQFLLLFDDTKFTHTDFSPEIHHLYD